MKSKRSDITRRTTVILSATIMICVTIIGLLYLRSEASRIESQNFDRMMMKGSIRQLSVVDLAPDSYYIAGIASRTIYLGNTKNPLNVLIVNTMTSGIRQALISLIGTDLPERKYLSEIYLQIDSPLFFLKDGSIAAFFAGSVNDWHAHSCRMKIHPFKQAAAISQNSIVTQATVGTTKGIDLKNVLTKNASYDPYFWKRELPESNGDYYTTDGILRFNRKSGELVYTYFYRNIYLVLDTGLNVIFEGLTIDGTRNTKIKRAKVSENVYALASPSSIVHHNSFASGNLLFIHSNLMGQGESRETFEQVSVIDIYDLETKKYKHSFYIPDFKGTKMNSFGVVGNRLIALFDRYLICYVVDESMAQSN